MHLQLTRTSPAFTDRQRQIIALIAAGCSTLGQLSSHEPE